MPQKFGLVRKLLGSTIEYLNYRFFFNSSKKKELIKEFHKFYYGSDVWRETYWFGANVYKCPFDLFIYQEIIYEIKPDVIIECGTARGGSALYLAHLCDMIGKGRIYTIDIENNSLRPTHNRINFITGSSVDAKIVGAVKKCIKRTDVVLVILDSNHAKNHVMKELELYAPIVTKGRYWIVEDSNINGHPVNKQHGEGPMEALKIFLRNDDSFKIDKSREKFFLTFNPNGYLKRVN